ncbi:MAG: SdrD B-like domain-containing protein, partial [Bacteroidota bacterium]
MKKGIDLRRYALLLLLLGMAVLPGLLKAQVCSTNTSYFLNGPVGGNFPLNGATFNAGTNTFATNLINTTPGLGGTAFATVNGSYFFIAQPDAAGTAQLFAASLAANGTLDLVSVLSNDSGIPQGVYGLATADGETFFVLSFDGTNESLLRGTLNPNGTLTLVPLNNNLSMPPGGFIRAFGTRNGTNFEFIVTDASGSAQFYNGTLSGNSFSYSLVNADSGIPNDVIMYASAVSRVEILDNSPVCEDERLLLSALNNYPMGGVLNYSWTGPGFTSNLQNPAITDFAAGNAGTYNLTVTFRNGETATCSTTVAAASAGACNSSNCDCTEYAYLNDILNDLTHKFEVQPNGDYVEIGNPWLTSNVIVEPHGVAIDANGFLYISSLTNTNVLQLNCDGDVIDATTEGVGSFNTEVIGNYLYSNGFSSITGGFPVQMFNNVTEDIFIDVFDLCDLSNERVGRVALFDPTEDNTDVMSWGLATNPVDGFLYAGDNYNNDAGANFQPGQGDIYRIDPRNPEAPGSPWQLGSRTTPIIQGLDRVMGITFDNTGAMYVVNQTVSGGNTELRKYTGSGTSWTLAMTVADNLFEFSGYNNAWGITYVETIDELLLTSFNEDCIARIDPANLNYIGPAIQHVPGALGKAVDVVQECCYKGPASITVNACQGEATFLRNELLNCAVCGGDWTLTGGTVGPNDYDACGQIFTASAATSDQVTFQFTSDNDQCGAVTVTLTVNIERPEASVGNTDATCAVGATTPTANAQINLTGIMDADVVGISLAGATSYNGPAYNAAAPGATLQAVSGGTANFTGLTHNTSYVVRVFNGSNTCFQDYTQMTNEVVCVCPAEPLVTITQATVATCGSDPATFNYTVENGPADLSENGTGVLSTTSLADGMGTFTYTPGTNESGTVTINAVIPDPDGPGICASSSDVAAVTVTPRPTVAITQNNINTCGTDPVTFSYTVTNGTATLMENGNGGLSTNSITGTGTFTYTPTATDNGVVTITAIVPDPDGGGPCTTVSDMATVTVTPRPVVTITPDNVDLCGVDVATFTYNVQNGTATVMQVGGNGTLSTTSISGSGTFTYSSTAADDGVVTITATVSANTPCPAVSDVVTATVTPRPSVTIVEDNVLTCQEDPATFNYTVENGPTNSFSSDGAGTLSVAQLVNGTNTFTYTPVPADFGNTVTITAIINDPDGAGPCVQVSDVATVTVLAPPFADLATTPATCNMMVNNVDGQINLTNVVGDVVGISSPEALVYDGSSYDAGAAAADLVPVVGGNANITDLPHNTAFIVRVFNRLDNCFEDYEIMTDEVDCSCSLNITGVVPFCTYDEATGESSYDLTINYSWFYNDFPNNPDFIQFSMEGQVMVSNVINTESGTGSVTFAGISGPRYGVVIEATFITTATCFTSAAFDLISCAPRCVTGVGGIVYNDIDNDGDGPMGGDPTELGQENVRVEVYDCDGVLVCETFTNANGEWSCPSLTDAATYPVRVEFSTPLQSFLQSSFVGVGNASSTQFVTAPSCDVNFGVINAAEFCQDNPQVVTTCFPQLDPTGSSVSAVLEFNYLSGATGIAAPFDGLATLVTQANGTGNAQPDNNSLIINSTTGQVGTVYGVAYHQNTNTVLAASYMRRFSLFPNGPSSTALGTIYAIDRSVNPNTSVPFFQGNAGTDRSSYAGFATGAFGVDFRLDEDQEGRDKVGLTGWGDIDITEDGQFLFAINYFDDMIYKIEIVENGDGTISSGSVERIAYPTNLQNRCSDADTDRKNWRPGALKIVDGRVYTSITCTAFTSGSRDDLHAWVYSFPVEGGAFVDVVDFELNYPRQDGSNDADAGGQKYDTDWLPWIHGQEIPDTAPDVITTNLRFRNYPTPHLRDIEFDDDGNLLIGISDHTASYVSAQFYLEEEVGQTSPPRREFFNAGDVLRFARTATGFEPELLLTPAAIAPEEEFFQGDGNTVGYDDRNNGTGCSDMSAHRETSFGSLLVIPGRDQVGTNSLFGGFTNGFRVMNTETGCYERFQILVPSNRDQLGKSQGLGDLESLCEDPPVQIGNFVWVDLNEDGIQQGCEDPLEGIEVKLYRKDGTNDPLQIASTVTDANGNYYFSSASAIDNDPNLMWDGSGADTSIIDGQTYFVAFCGDTGYDAEQDTFNVDGVLYCITSTDSGEGNNADLNDSDISEQTIAGTGDLPAYCTQAGEINQTNNTFDAGFKIRCPFVDLVSMTPPLCSTDTLMLVSIVDSVFGTTAYDYLWSTDGDGTFLDANNNPTLDYELAVGYLPGEQDILSGGVTLTLSSDPATLPADCAPVSEDLPVEISTARMCYLEKSRTFSLKMCLFKHCDR